MSNRSKQTTATHQGHQGDNRLTHSCHSRWKKHRAKYGYDSLGQVTNGVKYFRDGTPVAGQQFGYAFDDIGNRTTTLSGGDTNGVNLRVVNYSVNNLNQIISRGVPGTNDVVGATWATNSVSVNGVPAYRKVEYFQGTVGTNNVGSPAWLTAIVTNGTGSSVTGHIYVAHSPEQFSYDADGNLTNDGRWAYTWDGENRLIGMTVNTNVGPQYQLTFAYDAKGRRIQKIVATNGVALSTNNFLYDGWNLIAETRPNNSLIRSYVWGTDLSGTSQGAGGVGGLLEMSYYGSSTTNCFPAFDGNGNIMALVNAADGTVAANYDYAAFGEPIRITGVMARNNPFRFSTKYADDESDLLYYGYRYYKPSTGTWLSKDPIEENGEANLYGFVCNNPDCYVDTLGLRIIIVPPFFPPTINPLPIPIPIPVPVTIPGPILGPGDTLPTNFTGFAICQRPLNEDGVIDKCLNMCGQGHKFIAEINNGTPTAGEGFYPDNKTHDEKLLTCPRAKTCKLTNTPLRYGAGAGIKGSAASNAQILDCIKKHPPLGKYNAPFNDCRHFAAQAASDCGLDCGQ